MSMHDKQTYVHTSDSGGSSAGWFIGGILVVAIIIGAVFLLDGNTGGGGTGEVDIRVQNPVSDSATGGENTDTGNAVGASGAAETSGAAGDADTATQ